MNSELNSFEHWDVRLQMNCTEVYICRPVGSGGEAGGGFSPPIIC